MTKPIAEILIHNATEVGIELGLLLRKKCNIGLIGDRCIEYLVGMAQQGATVDKILMNLPVEILVNPREFAEQIHRAAQYRTRITECEADLLGKSQNKSGETPLNGYAKTVGKPQNNLCNSPRPNHTETAEADIRKEKSFLIMQDIMIRMNCIYAMTKQLSLPCILPTVYSSAQTVSRSSRHNTSAHAKGKALIKVMTSVLSNASSPLMQN